MTDTTTIHAAALRKLAETRKTESETVITLIISELQADVETRRQAEARAAKKLRDADMALTEPMKRLETAQAEIRKCQERIRHFQHLAEHDDLDTRIEGLLTVETYQNQLPVLENKAAVIQAELAGLHQRKTEAARQLEAEQKYIQALQRAMLHPLTDMFAQNTQAYIGYHLPRILIPVISSGDREDPQWQICHRMIGELMYIAGIRDTDYQLPDTGIVDTSEYMKNNEIPPQPSAQDLMESTRILAEHLTTRPTSQPEYLTPRPARITRPETEIPAVPDRYKKTR